MAGTVTTTPQPGVATEEQPVANPGKDPGFLVVCWDDPVNLMDYVTYVFQRVFGWTREKAEFHMLQVHREGRSVLLRAGLEQAEHYVHQLHQYSLHATLEPAR